MSKINSLKFVKITDTTWIYTDPSTNDFRINITIQKEVLNNVMLTKSIELRFVLNKQQCDDCRKSFTPHVYTSKVQVRQVTMAKELKRTMLFLEQLILKHNAHIYCSAVENHHEGVDFKFTEHKYGQRFCAFLKTVIPVKIDSGKELVSFNEQNNEYRYKTN